jgi:hypothetical protein
MADDDTREAADSMRARVPESSAKIWVLMEMNRWVLTGVLLVVVLVALLVLAQFDGSPLAKAVQNKDPIETLFQAMVGAIITGVTLVVTLNQLVLSQELGPVGDQRERMSGAVDFREEVEPHLSAEVSPTDPSTFLQSLVEAVKDRAETLDSAVDDDGSSFREEIETFVSELRTNADEVTDRLAPAQFGTFDVLNAALNFNYSAKIYDARRLRAQYEDEVGETAHQALDELVALLELFGPAREHFKTLYFQWELINLSRGVLYAAVPAFVTAGSMILFFDDPGSIPGTLFGVSNILLVTVSATVLTLTPFMLLLSYILRIATMAKHTLAIGPFVLRGPRTGGDDD